MKRGKGEKKQRFYGFFAEEEAVNRLTAEEVGGGRGGGGGAKRIFRGDTVAAAAWIRPPGE